MPDGLYEVDALAWSERQAGLLRRLAAGAGRPWTMRPTGSRHRCGSGWCRGCPFTIEALLAGDVDALLAMVGAASHD